MFPKLDIERLKTSLKVEQQAIKQAGQGLPSTSDTSLDSPQEEIIVHLRGVHSSGFDEASERLVALKLKRRELLNSLDDSQILAEFEAVPVKAKGKVVQLESEKWDRLKFLRIEEQKALRQYNVFRELNGLTHRQAHYPSSSIYHWALVTAAVFAESVANSYFFKDATDSGFLGGIFVATLISVVNVLMASAVLGKHVLPQFNHIRPFRRYVFGGVGTVFCVAVILLINLAAAHTRAIISHAVRDGSLASTEAFREAIIALKERPLAIDDFEAWMLFVIGLIIAFFAAVKGYGADDSYPNYGHEDRLRKMAQQEYANERKAYNEQVLSRIRTVEEEMRSLLDKVRKQVKEYNSAFEESRQTIDAYPLFLAHLNSAANSLLRTYRDINSRIRASQEPLYFKEERQYFTQNVGSLPQIDRGEEEARQTINQLQRNVEKLFQENHSKLLEIQEEYASRIPKYYKSIEAEADIQLSDEEHANRQ